MITSADNPKIKRARSLLERKGRTQEGSCLIEGVRLIEDAMRAGVHPALVFFSADPPPTQRVVLLLATARAAGSEVWEVSPAVLATLTDTVASQGLVAVAPLPTLSPPPNPAFVLVLDGIRDPGNMGTILRSAAAAGADLVVPLKGCVDPWGPKVLRSGMGAHFRLALAPLASWPDVDATIGKRRVWLAEAAGERVYDEVDWTVPCALVIGGETTGISTEARARGVAVAIPMANGAESLNAAMAATVIMFEAARQGRLASAKQP